METKSDTGTDKNNNGVDSDSLTQRRSMTDSCLVDSFLCLLARQEFSADQNKTYVGYLLQRCEEKPPPTYPAGRVCVECFGLTMNRGGGWMSFATPTTTKTKTKTIKAAAAAAAAASSSSSSSPSKKSKAAAAAAGAGAEAAGGGGGSWLAAAATKTAAKGGGSSSGNGSNGSNGLLTVEEEGVTIVELEPNRTGLHALELELVTSGGLRLVSSHVNKHRFDTYKDEVKETARFAK
jgi:hypothetical protein